MAEKENLPPRDFVDALVEDPANPPQLQVLTGYRGRSAEEGHTRLYIDPELTGWVDIPDQAILYRREVQDEYGLGKSLVWTKLDAQLKQGPQSGGGTGADFLNGQVAQDLGAGAGLGGAQPIRTLLGCPTHAPFLCPVTPPRLCPPRTPLLGCPSVGIACTVFPPCPTRDPVQCGLGTANPLQCPSLGIACTFVPPCPPRTQNPEQCPTWGFTCTALPPQCPQRTANPEQCPTLGIACTALPQCNIPQPTSSPQFCPVATPNPGCIPTPGGFTPITTTPQIGGIDFGQFGGQEGGGFAGVQGGAEAAQLNPAFRIHTAFCPFPRTVFEVHCRPTNQTPCLPRSGFICQPMSPWCPITFPITGPGPTTTPVQLTGQFGGGQFGDQFGGGFAGVQGGGGMEAAGFTPAIQIQPSAQIVCQLRTVQEPQCWQIITRQPRCWHTRIQEICQPIPVSPWCPITFPITGPTTTPVQITIVGGAGQFGGHFGGGQFGGGAQEMGAQGLNFQQNTAFCPVQQQPSVQICATPTLAANCLHNTRNQICQITVVTRPDVCQTGWPTFGACPSLACPTQGCPFGGGGGFGGGF